MALLIGMFLALGVGLFAHLVGFDRDRAFYATVLVIVGSYYVLFAVMGGGSGLTVELLFFAVFAALAVIGFRTSLWVVVAGLAGHGLFDFLRLGVLPGSGVPVWWPGFCGSYDVVAAAGLAVLLLLRKRRTVHAQGDSAGAVRGASGGAGYRRASNGPRPGAEV
ncbi:hypothetical protein [Sphingomonas sp.]|uniref:hypothetical protein n=1 Tax=Sphingomonas sp. TaxID=28214 RepID=UPI00389D3152